MPAKVCRVPQTEPGFSWSAEAIRTLTGHGDLYIRLRKRFDVPVHKTQATVHQESFERWSSSSVQQCVVGTTSALRPSTSTSTGSPVVRSSCSSHDAVPSPCSSPVQTSVDLTTLNEHNRSGDEEFP